MAKSIGKLIDNFIEQKDLTEIKILVSVEKKWKEVVGKSIYNKTKIIDFKKGILIIQTINSVWRNELEIQKDIILQKLKEQQFNNIITEIKFK